MDAFIRIFGEHFARGGILASDCGYIAEGDVVEEFEERCPRKGFPVLLGEPGKYGLQNQTRFTDHSQWAPAPL